jgi:hypothetical protein
VVASDLGAGEKTVATLHDPVRRQAYLSVLADWRFGGCVVFGHLADAWLRKNLPDRTLRGIKQDVYNYVKQGGEIDYVKETRDLEVKDQYENCVRDYRYDLRIPMCGRRLYFETVLIDDDPSDMQIVIVNAKDA